MRRNFQPGGNCSLLRISRRREDSLLDFLVALDCLVLLAFQELLQFVEIALDGVGQAGELVRQQIGIGKSHDGCAHGL